VIDRRAVTVVPQEEADAVAAAVSAATAAYEQRLTDAIDAVIIQYVLTDPAPCNAVRLQSLMRAHLNRLDLPAKLYSAMIGNISNDVFKSLKMQAGLNSLALALTGLSNDVFKSLIMQVLDLLALSMG
jgi:hypothetical protein